MNRLHRVIAIAIEPRTALLTLTIVSCLGALAHVLLVWLTPAPLVPLYFSLIVLVCAIGIASLYVLRTDQETAILIYAWLAGVCLGAMMAYDALRCERYDHLLWIYPVGVAYLVIYVNSEHAFLYALGSSLLGALLGLCESRLGDCIFQALMPLALWVLSASVADVILGLQRENEDVRNILEIWERAER